MRLRFRNLPLVEVAVRFTFDDPLRLGLAEAKRSYEFLSEAFPSLEDVPGFEAPPGLKSLKIESPSALFGFRLSNSAKGTSLTFQHQLIASRWADNMLHPKYVGFEVLEDGMRKAMTCLQESNVQLTPVSVANMVYVNFVAADQGTSEELGKYLLGLPQTSRFTEATDVHQLLVSWREHDDVDMTLDVKGATRTIGDTKETGFRLATAAGLRFDPKNEPFDIVTCLHDRLQQLFAEVLTDNAKELWGMEITE